MCPKQEPTEVCFSEFCTQSWDPPRSPSHTTVPTNERLAVLAQFSETIRLFLFQSKRRRSQVLIPLPGGSEPSDPPPAGSSPGSSHTRINRSIKSTLQEGNERLRSLRLRSPRRHKTEIICSNGWTCVRSPDYTPESRLARSRRTSRD